MQIKSKLIVLNMMEGVFQYYHYATKEKKSLFLLT